MEFYKNGIAVGSYSQTYGSMNVVVSIDSSKSNTAMMVWDEYGNPMDDYEISGAGSDVDVYDLCWQTRKELKNLFNGANILRVGIEDIITKNEKGYKGIEIHQSRYKITAVFDNLIFFFQEYHNQTPRRINNQAWKAGVLPEHLRKKDIHKGSKLFCEMLGNRWAGRKDDVTDCYCIGLYMFMTEKFESSYAIESTVPFTGSYEFGIFPISFPIPANAKNFIIKNTDTLQHNIETIASRVRVGQPGCVKVVVGMLSIDDVYSDRVQYSKQYRYDKGCSEVLVVVFRKEQL